MPSMCPSIMRPHGAKAANSAGRTFERPRTSPNSLSNPAIHGNPVIKPELVEFAQSLLNLSQRLRFDFGFLVLNSADLVKY